MPMPAFYQHDDVKTVRRHCRRYLPEHPYELSVRELLGLECSALVDALAEGDPVARVQLGHWCPPQFRNDSAHRHDSAVARRIMQFCVAREHGYANWSAVQSDATRHDPVFEHCVDCTVSGQLTRLEQLIDVYPEVVYARSPYPHRATLLHYLAADGVELRRQTSPYNARAIAELLIDAGADVNAEAGQVAGSPLRPLTLLRSSPHALQAGTREAIAEVLLSYGAVS